MDKGAIILELFIRVGYVSVAVVLCLAWWLARRQRDEVTRLTQVANGVAGFYALCMVMIGAVVLLRTHAWANISPWLYQLLVIVILFLTIRTRPQWLSLPFAVLFHFSFIRTWIGTGEKSAADQLLTQLWSAKPYILLLMGLLYLLLVFLLYLLGIWLRRVVQEVK